MFRLQFPYNFLSNKFISGDQLQRIKIMSERCVTSGRKAVNPPKPLRLRDIPIEIRTAVISAWEANSGPSPSLLQIVQHIRVTNSYTLDCWTVFNILYKRHLGCPFVPISRKQIASWYPLSHRAWAQLVKREEIKARWRKAEHEHNVVERNDGKEGAEGGSAEGVLEREAACRDLVGK